LDIAIRVGDQEIFQSIIIEIDRNRFEDRLPGIGENILANTAIKIRFAELNTL
jgi:hypothetical protein